MDKGRKADLEELLKQREHATGDKKKYIEHLIDTIVNEPGAVKSMRESLIRATRRGDYEEVKDIHEYIKHKSKYKNI